ncbi:hypothetical protein CPAR01_06291 [Colletotrichum paranaense]|uniref:Arrestin-like N-terminal domain-containing protein n=1 Tax=Colletotrichum paranaense TaxID=1914294 RepID=A0ABQ9SL94_9PEZI|nr:uncharacterized protein CPAR01_06291 [Colletotrichum paranaense]KAK1540302.1 hypothetical protein CPAR01_06291 [Colletotrichum paranaense]
MITPAEVKGGPGLSIHLLDPSIPLYPGFIIRGHVTQKSHIVAAFATIRFCLMDCYDAGFEFWNQNAVSQVVHRVPLHTDGKALNEGLRRVQREASYLRAPEDVTGKQALPEVLSRSGDTGGGEEDAPSRGNAASAGIVTAGAGGEHGFRNAWHDDGRICDKPSGMEHAELTWNQKMQMFLGSKRVPAWHFKLRVECSSVIQLGNPAATPFRLNIIPDRAKSSDLLRDVLQKVYLTNAVINLLTIAGVSCPGRGEAHEGKCTETMTLHIDQAIAVKTGLLLVPLAAGERALELSAPLDARSRSAPREHKHHFPLGPDYTTYGFFLAHTFKWKFHLVVAGESWKCSGSQEFVVSPAVERVAAADTQS